MAVFSDADALAPHVAWPTQPCIGAAGAESYLNAVTIVEAPGAGADAIHPGYGFCRERQLRAGLPRCRAGVHRPAARGHRAMGDKARPSGACSKPACPARRLPGRRADDATLRAGRPKLGFPLLVKAVAGGGGRGMRLVRAPNSDEAIAGARREAQSAFRDGTLMLERLIEHGRHIEIQVFADAHGHASTWASATAAAAAAPEGDRRGAVAGGRRRHARAWAATPGGARAVGYRGAGTVEFIVDQSGQLLLPGDEHAAAGGAPGHRVRHRARPGRVAAARGRRPEPLPLTQDDIKAGDARPRHRGPACTPKTRTQGFAPQTGTVLHWRPTRRCSRRRAASIDGIREGITVSPFYDAMVAKLIAHGRDRDDAIRRLIATLARRRCSACATTPLPARPARPPTFARPDDHHWLIDAVGRRRPLCTPARREDEPGHLAGRCVTTPMRPASALRSASVTDLRPRAAARPTPAARARHPGRACLWSRAWRHAPPCAC